MPRRKPLPPDIRPLSTDPNLPVYGKSGRAIDPEKMVIKAKMTLASSEEPNWRDDLTYNLRKNKP